MTHSRVVRFPSTWPVYTPAQKLANWLEYYAEALELPVWTSSEITSANQDQDNKWHLTVKRGSGAERKLVVNHLVFATGIAGGSYRPFHYPGLVSRSTSATTFDPYYPTYRTSQDKFQGKYLHSSKHQRALDHAGKKVVVVGACTSGKPFQIQSFHFSFFESSA